MKPQVLLEEALATIERLKAIHPDLQKELDNAYAYAVFPSVGRASVVVGVSYGRGVVFERGNAIGIVTMAAVTIGVQIGGQTFSELLFFPAKEALEKLQRGELAFAANASAALVKAAASGTSDFHGVTAKAFSQGGMLLELSLGGQKLSFSPEFTKSPRREERELHVVSSPARDAAEPPKPEPPKPEPPKPPAPTAEPAPVARARGLADRVRSFARRVEHAMPAPVRSRLAPIAARLAPLERRLSTALAPLAKEEEVSRVLHPESQAALARMYEQDPPLRDRLAQAAGYAIFPSVGKASAVIGATYGRGEVFEKDRLIGYAALIQLTIGLQLGGDTFTELVIFETAEALERFKQGNVAFAANAAAVIVKAGVAATTDSPPGADVQVFSEGGLLLEAALGGQKFVYRGAALTRGKTAEPASA